MISNLLQCEESGGEDSTIDQDLVRSSAPKEDATDHLEFDDEEEEARSDKVKCYSRILFLLLFVVSCSYAEEEEERIKKQREVLAIGNGQNSTAMCHRAKKPRLSSPKFFVDPMHGCLRPMISTLSCWWIMYVENPQPESKKWSKTFRLRFRLPYSAFVDFLDMIQADHTDMILHKWRKPEAGFPHLCRSWKLSPLQLLMMGSLRYLGRGLTFDDLEEYTFISRDVHRVFFHAFIKYGATKLYQKYVTMPESIEVLRECEKAYRIAGFPGCIGSTDATHIPLDKVAFSLRQAHLGFKNSVTTRTYNLSVNHKRQILNSTTGHPGRWNDKTLVRFDPFVSHLQSGSFDNKMVLFRCRCVYN
jgi:hypothetical protein